MIAADGEGQIRRLCCHPRWEKISLVVSSNRVHVSVNRSRYSTRRREDHKRSIPVLRKITYKKEFILALKIILFLDSQSDQITVSAPTLRRFLNLCSIPCNQLPNILATLHGGYRPEATWMTDHIERANLHWKQMLNNLFMVTGDALWTTMPIPLDEIIFSKNHSLSKIPHKNLCF